MELKRKKVKFIAQAEIWYSRKTLRRGVGITIKSIRLTINKDNFLIVSMALFSNQTFITFLSIESVPGEDLKPYRAQVCGDKIYRQSGFIFGLL